ncbi:hypothetical protein X296_05475 [Oenococcus oeni IOEB_L26_1]|nr:hypothetical protein X281_00350 [Oenococcus oeni IOEB_0607]KGH89607.1 hypothetical protein X296_05475 [Oenococcus oeni IOEB_L26_1]KGO16615.1 hypothetical protein OA32_03340 [Oenococcus oeni X2L]OIK61922.1 hypothetical protein ATW63_03300 [Oenococcus oeni]OIK89053.1 hypothetical protein ATW80_03345 [Oenococcus oeni]
MHRRIQNKKTVTNRAEAPKRSQNKKITESLAISWISCYFELVYLIKNLTALSLINASQLFLVTHKNICFFHIDIVS